MHPFQWISALIAGLLLASTGVAQENPGAGQEEEDWLEFYYRDPTPDRLVSEVKEWAADGLFDSEKAKPAIIAFLSQVFRQNRDQIAGWYEQLAGLTAEQRQVIHTALLFSRTTEADKLLREHFGKKYDEEKELLPKILELELARENTLDMLWGYYYATGSPNAIRRIISCFRFEDAPDNPEFAKVPENFKPLYKTLPDAAGWSLTSNALRHPHVRRICEVLYEDDETLLPTEKQGLGKVLEESKPDEAPEE